MTAYYNEFDPFAAEWLRTLMLHDLIAWGDVDERNLWDVPPDDLRPYTQVHLCAGIGVWSYALRAAGWPDDRPVWTASFPCQPFSAAGKGLGFADERHLWPAGFHLIRAVRPERIFGEQVASKDGLAWLDLVQTDVEAEGYAFGAVDLCAAGVGAPHIRQRSFWVADADNPSEHALLRQGSHDPVEDFRRSAVGGLERYVAGRNRSQSGGLADAEHHDGRADEQGWGPDKRAVDGGCSPTLRLGDDGDARPQGHAGYDGAAGGRQGPQRSASETSVSGRMAHTDGRDTSAERQQCGGEQRQQPDDGCGGAGLCAPTNGFWRDADWLGCRDAKWRPVEPGTFPLAHGSSNRVGRLRGYGNAIVAPVAQEFIEAVMACRP